MLVLLQITCSGNDETEKILVSTNNIVQFCDLATQHICAYKRSNCLDDEIADSECMLPGFEKKINDYLNNFDFENLLPNILLSLSCVLPKYSWFDDCLWFKKEKFATKIILNPPKFKLMRRPINLDEEKQIYEAIRTKNEIEELILDIGCKTRDWILVYETSENKPKSFLNPVGFEYENEEYRAHLQSIEDRNHKPRIMPKGTNILNLQ